MNSEEIIKYQYDENKALKAANDLLKKHCEQYAQAYEQMHDQLKELIRNRFGKKSERYIDPEHPQLNLLDGRDKFFSAEAEGNKIEDIQVPGLYPE